MANQCYVAEILNWASVCFLVGHSPAIVDHSSICRFKFRYFASQVLAKYGISGVYFLSAKLKLLDS